MTSFDDYDADDEMEVGDYDQYIGVEDYDAADADDTDDDPYPGLREVLAEGYQDLSPEGIEGLLESYGLDAEDMEFSLADIGRAVAKVAPAVLPVAGTVVGTAFGGPLGAMAGGALGRLAGGAIGSATGRRAPARRPALLGAAASRLPAIGGSPAAAQLLQVLRRPEVLRSLQSMALGSLGARHVPVGGTRVPVGAFANLLGTLANEAAAEHHVVIAGSAEPLPEYLLDANGEAMVDAADSDERAYLLLEMLDAVAVGEAWAELADSDDASGEDEDDTELAEYIEVYA